MSASELPNKARAAIFRELLAGTSVENLARKFKVEKSQILRIRSEAEAMTRVYAPRGWVQEPAGTRPQAGRGTARSDRTKRTRKAKPVVARRISAPSAIRQSKNPPVIALSDEQWALIGGAIVGWCVVLAAEQPSLQLLGLLAGGTIAWALFKVWARIKALETQVDQLKGQVKGRPDARQ